MIRSPDHSDGVTTADLPVLQHRGVDPNVCTVVLGCCTQDTRIPGEIALGKSGHHAAGARTGDAQANGISYSKDVPNPGILHKVLLAGCDLHHDVRAKPSDFETPLWIELPQPIERGCGQYMNQGTIEKGTLRQTEVGNGVPMLKA